MTIYWCLGQQGFIYSTVSVRQIKRLYNFSLSTQIGDVCTNNRLFLGCCIAVGSRLGSTERVQDFSGLHLLRRSYQGSFLTPVTVSLSLSGLSPGFVFVMFSPPIF